MPNPGLAEELAQGAFGVVGAAVWGALWGSFFNVVAARVPRGESLVRPPSHCRSCKAPVAWYDNVPVLSYLLLRGRCRRCGARYSARYLLVELLIAALAVLMHHVFVVRGEVPIGLRLGQFAVTSLFSGLLVAVALIDLDTLRIPDAITYPGIPTAVVLSLFMSLPHPWDGPVGGAAGYLLIRGIADGYRLATGRLGMGYGDAKLLAMVGGLLGWQVLLPTIFLAAVQGSIIGIGALAIARRRGADRPPVEPDATDDRSETTGDEELPLRHAAIPFGPFISLAAIEVLVLRPWLPLFFPYLPW
ncbi:MAG: prepilin peptidase [Deltaproteobacteria bacterium]|nr:prepilin peptidase [Deltaproteobacteria bacterium]